MNALFFTVLCLHWTLSSWLSFCQLSALTSTFFFFFKLSSWSLVTLMTNIVRNNVEQCYSLWMLLTYIDYCWQVISFFTTCFQPSSLVLISVTSRDSTTDDVHAGNLLENVFNAMVLLYGLDELTNIKNIERFKKEIKVCGNFLLSFKC